MDKAVLITIFYMFRVVFAVLRELTLMHGMASYEEVKEMQEQVEKLLDGLMSDDG